jgi:hypothetical protein
MESGRAPVNLTCCASVTRFFSIPKVFSNRDKLLGGYKKILAGIIGLLINERARNSD